MLTSQTTLLDSTALDILAECAGSTQRMAEVFFPHHFWKGLGDSSKLGWTGGFSSSHKQLFEFLDADPKKYPRKLIIAHREFGKSTCVQLPFVARKLLFNFSNFIVPISDSATQAIMHSQTLKDELVNNDLIKHYWGGIESTTDFSKIFWVANLPDDAHTRIAVMPRGTGQKVRGIKFGPYRPSTLIFDDIENSKEVLNRVLRDELSSWCLNDAIGSLQSGVPNDVIAVGTILHEDSQIERWRTSGDWEVLSIPLCDSSYKSCNPDYKPQEEVDRKLAEHRNANDLDGFAREYMNLVIATENKTFKSEYFKYHDENDLKALRLENFVLVDPAKTGSKHSDDWAIANVAADYAHDMTYIRDMVVEVMHPDRGIQEVFDMVVRSGSRTLGIEVTGLNDWILQPFTEEAIRRKLPLKIVELHAKGSKTDRILALLPSYRAGRISHNKACTTKLEQQFSMFPRSAKDDAMDVIAHTLQLLYKGDRFLSYNSDISQEEEAEIESEYADLALSDYDTELLVSNPL